VLSANCEGARPNFNGTGVSYSDLAMMAGVATTCEECEGSGSRHRCWTTTLRGRNISEVLAMFGQALRCGRLGVMSSAGR
jgi:excinuclease UvrABC ATPase subunit